jgi:asparagine synthase (glutamine-hydrolysing)
MGEKPLYYGWQSSAKSESKESFIFASELSALKGHPAFNADISRDAIHTFMRYNNVGGSQSIYEGINKLPAGFMLTLKIGSRLPVLESYWSALDESINGRQSLFCGDSTEAIDSLEGVLSNSIKYQMVSDVPLGAFLSGGVDSSLIVALMQQHSAKPIQTFSVGFKEHSYNEAEQASAVALHLGANHQDIYVTSQDALNLIPELPTIYSEPFADSSQIPTFLLSKLARQHVTVALSGDGGDELFGGYNRYQFTNKHWHWMCRTPLWLRHRVASILMLPSLESWDLIITILKPFFPSIRRLAHPADMIYKGAKVMASVTATDLYISLVSHWQNTSELVIGGHDLPLLSEATLARLSTLSYVDQIMILDMLTYMSDDILTKVDRASMATSLEVRIPFLDHRVVEFASRLPATYTCRDAQSTWILRQVLSRYVPKQLIGKPKMGFGLPIGQWLRGPLREWAEGLLNEKRLQQDGYLNSALIREAWQQHISGRFDLGAKLWTVLLFQAWLESQ